MSERNNGRGHDIGQHMIANRNPLASLCHGTNLLRGRRLGRNGAGCSIFLQVHWISLHCYSAAQVKPLAGVGPGIAKLLRQDQTMHTCQVPDDSVISHFPAPAHQPAVPGGAKRSEERGQHLSFVRLICSQNKRATNYRNIAAR